MFSFSVHVYEIFIKLAMHPLFVDPFGHASLLAMHPLFVDPFGYASLVC
jgi:hypothetical protein